MPTRKTPLLTLSETPTPELALQLQRRTMTLLSFKPDPVPVASNINSNAVPQQFVTPTKSMLPVRVMGHSQSERRPAHKRLSSVRADDADVAPERSSSADGGGDGRSPRRRLSVGFKAVEIREYERLHGGSGGVPYVGAYPLGLGWQVAAERRDSLSNFESERSSQRHRSDDLPRIEESERRKLLEKHDARPRLERAASYVAQRRELDALRKARSAIGCSCSRASCRQGRRGSPVQPAAATPQCCSTDECECYRNGLECWEESCACGNRLNDLSQSAPRQRSLLRCSSRHHQKQRQPTRQQVSASQSKQ
jgi:hypothetical protein